MFSRSMTEIRELLIVRTGTLEALRVPSINLTSKELLLQSSATCFLDTCKRLQNGLRPTVCVLIDGTAPQDIPKEHQGFSPNHKTESGIVTWLLLRRTCSGKSRHSNRRQRGTSSRSIRDQQAVSSSWPGKSNFHFYHLRFNICIHTTCID